MINYFYALYEADNDTFIAEFDTAGEVAEFMAGRVYRDLTSRIKKIKELVDNSFCIHKYKNSKGPIIEFHVYKFIDDRDSTPEDVDWLGNPPNIDNWLKERK
jgi:hypothetical protein